MKRLLRWIGVGAGVLVVLGAVAYAVIYVMSERIFGRHYDAPASALTVPSDAASIAEGRRLATLRGCLGCHGKDGDGKGEVGADMKLKVSDLSDPATLKDRTDGELFYIIKNGKGDMPPEGTRLKSDELWSLVNYVRSLAKKNAAPEDKKRQ